MGPGAGRRPARPAGFDEAIARTGGQRLAVGVGAALIVAAMVVVATVRRRVSIHDEQGVA